MGEGNQGIRDENSIAIVGMACCFPDAATPGAFWRNLAAGRESVRDFDEAGLQAAGVPAAQLASPDYVRAGVPLEGFDCFDAAFFGLSPAEAKVMDPQHRKFLECAWSALEDAGHTPRSAGGNIGVFAGSGMHWYMLRNLMANPALVDELGEFLVRHTANDKDFLATRVSYQLDLRGPSINVQTACSTSLVAVHLACQSLLGGECDMALAGGSTIEVPHNVGYLYREEEVRSRDGRCRAMDAAAGGTVFGSGCGIVVLRRLADALADGDTIHAVVRGSAINNDGAAKAGYLAPSVDGQAQAIVEALAVADIDPATIGYVEAHGTGTRIGDPIEVAALTQAFGTVPRRQYCALGSVKTNIGHLDTAAGVAGLIKVALALREGQLPPSLHYRQPNPEIDFAASPFYVNTALSDWPALGAPRRAGISSLGVGGTNAHLVLEQAPAVQPTPATPAEVAYVLPLSAKTPAALAEAAAQLAAHLQDTPAQSLADVAWTLRNGRVPFAHRLAVSGRDRDALVQQLQSPPRPVRAADAAPPVVLMFPGQGAQYPGMARGLLETDAAFRAAMEACFDVLQALGRDDVRAALHPADGGADPGADPDAGAVAVLRATEVTQPALFCVEYALAKSLLAKGLQPAAMIGHSLGEYVAACLAGIFSLEAALRLVCRRGELVASLSPGAMLAVAASPATLAPYLSPRVVVAGANAPDLCTCSGAEEDIAALAGRLEEQGIGVRRLETSHAFHSPMLDPILPAFRAAVAEAVPRAVPDTRIVSNVTGRWLTAEEAASPDYWVRQLRQRVEFSAGMAQLQALGAPVFVECGPGRALSGFARAHSADARVVTTLRQAKDATPDAVVFAGVAGALWAHGVEPDWDAWAQPRGRRVPLPTYAFQRQRHWVEPAPARVAPESVDEAGRRPFEEWSYVTDWRTAPPARGRAPSRVLLFGGTWGVAQALAERLRERGIPVVGVDIGAAFAANGERFAIDPASDTDWDRLAEAVGVVSHIAYLWPVDTAMASVAKITAGCFDHLLRLARRLERFAGPEGLHLLAATANAHQVGGETGGNPHQALAAGPLRTIPREFPGCRTRWVDLDAANVERSVAEAAGHLLGELSGDFGEDTIAWRNRRRLRPVLTRSRLERAADGALKPGGRYVITGGFGGAGQALACHLASRYRAHLVLVARTALPPPSEREAWLAASRPGDPVRHRLQVVRRLEALGAKVDVVAADVADGWVLARAIAELGVSKLDGVFHAAGVLDDAPMATKSVEAAHRVLHPKVAGALGLQSLLQFAPEFILYFSSMSAQAGVAGQVDYTAANAFLSAFADVADAQSGSTRHVAVEWSIWRDAGMAAALAARSGLAPVAPADADLTDHPVLHWVSRTADGGAAYAGMVDAESVWFLDQHRLGSGEAILPGTAYIELLAAALQLLRGRFVPLRISTMTLSAPLLLRPRDRRLLRVEVVPAGTDRYRVAVSSLGADPDDVLEHAAATVAVLAPGEVPVGATLPSPGPMRVVEGPYAHPALVFGPRWDCLTRLEVGEVDASLQLDLKTPEDLTAHPFHPALLDMALGAAQQELAPALRGQLVPFQYGEIVLLAPLTRALDSRIRGRVGEDRLVQDVDIRAPDGTLLAVVRDFVLARMRAGRITEQAAKAPKRRGKVNPILDVGFADGLSNPEALAVLEAVLASRGPAQVTIAARDATALVRDMRHACEGEPEARDETAFPARPDLGVPYVAPQAGLQQAIAAMWEAMLEVRGIGAHDNFFELGGHSLLLTRLVSRLKRDQGLALPIDQAIEEPTIARWSALAAQARPAAAVPKVDRNRYRVTG